MKRLASILLLGLACFIGRAQDTNQVPASLTGNFTNIWDNIITFAAGGSNWILVPFGTVWDKNPKTEFGGGVALTYKLSEFVMPVMRLDYLNSDLWLPSGTVQLQVPIHLSSKLTVYPFAFGGVGTSISGNGADNGTANAIYGMGAAIKISNKVDLIFDYEQWSELPGNQWRFGIGFRL